MQARKVFAKLMTTGGVNHGFRGCGSLKMGSGAAKSRHGCPVGK